MNRSYFNGLITGLVAGGIISFGLVSISGRLADTSDIAVKPQDAKEQVQPEKLLESNGFKTKYNNIIAQINKSFLNEKDVNSENIADGMYQGIIDSLGDKYADYYTAKEYSDYVEQFQGQYGGIGAYVAKNSETGDIVIVNPFDDAPAAKAGMKAGDILIEIGGESVAGKSLDDAVTLMKGEAGTSIHVKILRDKKEIEMDVVREVIDVPTVSHTMLKDEDIGYIYVSAFDDITVTQFNDAIKDLEKKNAKGLIIDIRDNGGGRLDTVVAMLNRILSEGMIMYTETRYGMDEKFEADSKESYDKPIVVMINQYSASASEVFAGALKDHKRATLVGTKSYGKGVVQTLYPLTAAGDGSAIKITTAKYFTPSGNNIDGIGITPDVEIEYDKDKSVRVGKETRDNQLQKAIEVMKEKL